MKRASVIDLSHHNTVVDFNAIEESGVVGVIHKLTDGTSYVDSKAKARRSGVIASGMLWGLYHFLRPGDIDRQASFFLATAKPLMDKNTLLCCDFEVDGIPLSHVLQFMQFVETQSGRSPVLYSGHTLKEAGIIPADLRNYRLWLSQYGPKAELPKGYKNYWLWQFSEKGTVPGISGAVDLNYFGGTDEELAAEWSGSKSSPGSSIPPPVAPPAPAPPVTAPKPDLGQVPPPEVEEGNEFTEGTKPDEPKKSFWERLTGWQEKVDKLASFKQSLSPISGSSKFSVVTTKAGGWLLIALGFFGDHWLWVIGLALIGLALWYLARAKANAAKRDEPAAQTQSQTVVVK